VREYVMPSSLWNRIGLRLDRMLIAGESRVAKLLKEKEDELHLVSCVPRPNDAGSEHVSACEGARGARDAQHGGG
jgi:hypothetical protein